MYEKRERVRKKDLEEQAVAKGGKKAPPPKKEDPKAKGKGATEEKPKVPIAPPEDEQTLQLPEPEQHVNASIVEFLDHFKSQRLIMVPEPDSASKQRKRGEEEKEQLKEDKNAQREVEKQFYEQVLSNRDEVKEQREKFKKEAQVQVASDRTSYKEKLGETIDARNKYRDKIILRNEKMRALTDLLAQDKIDLNQLQAAVDAAIENTVRKDVIERGQKQLQWLKYCKSVE